MAGMRTIETTPAQARQAGGEAALDNDTGAAEPEQRALQEAGGELARLALGVDAAGFARGRAGTAGIWSGQAGPKRRVSSRRGRGRSKGRRGREISAR